MRELRLAVERLHSCKARHLRSETVHEVFQGKTAWQGVVEVFEISGHAQAKHCYAWKHWEDEGGKHERLVTVLELPPVNSAATAVRAQLVNDQPNRANEPS